MHSPASPRITCLTQLTALEDAVGAGSLRGWDALLQRDPCATFFQGPVWTLCWYRAYAGLFDPLVLVLELDDALVGLAPMAVERRTGRLAFAGDNMADYRDVVALPEHREQVIRELVRLYRAARPRASLRFGSTLPESTSPPLVVKVCREEGVPALALAHHGWRWWPEQADGDPLKSRSARYKLNRIKRRGEVSVSTIGGDQWPAFRREYFDHHSLRQVSRGTDVSFDRPEKRRFFDALIGTPLAHVTALCAGGIPIAWHYGCLDRGVLYLGAPAFDVREHRQSPGLLLILLIMKQSATWGIRGVDLTIGEGDLKERYSTSQVVLPTIELFPHRRARLRRRLSQRGASALRRAFNAVGRETVWKGAIRPAFAQLRDTLADARAMPPCLGLRYVADTLVTPLVRRPRTAVFALSGDGAPPPSGGTGSPRALFGLNETRHFLQFDYDDRYVFHLVRGALREVADAPAAGADLHTMVVDGRLTAWAMSTRVEQATASGLDGLTLPPGSGLLWGVGGVRHAPGPLAALIRHAVAHRTAAGDSRIWLLARNPSASVRQAAALAGFHLLGAGVSRDTRTVAAPIPAESESAQ